MVGRHAGRRRRANGHMRLMAAGMLAGALGGCGFFVPDRIHYQWSAASFAPCETCDPGQPEGEMIGLALSGGGSRAAVFGAAVLEALAEHGLTERITHVSSVSGGGFAASYFAKDPASDCAGLESEARGACLASYFSRFKTAMRANYFLALELNQFTNPNRLTSPTRRISSLQDALDEEFLNEASFAALPKKPALLINAASYDDGRRFIFSNMTIPDEPAKSGPLAVDALRAGSFSRPGCPRPTPGEFPLALAVATSAAFPPYLGPVSLQIPRGCENGKTHYERLGDGGIIDNTGVDTLEEIALREIRAGALKRVLILSADSGKPPFLTDLRERASLGLWTSNPGAVVDVAQTRGKGYHDLVWNSLRRESGAPFEIITIRYTDAELERWPDSCASVAASGVSMREHIIDIPTDLKITDCDADLMEAAGHMLTHEAIEQRRRMLERFGLRVRDAAFAH